MGRELKRLKRRKDVVSRLDALLEQATTTLVIHYSCESFYDKTDGKTPRVTSLAVRNLASGQTDSFSIHQIAEEQHVAFEQIAEHYDALERHMLDRFFDFLRTRQHCNWIHWNMRGIIGDRPRFPGSGKLRRHPDHWSPSFRDALVSPYRMSRSTSSSAATIDSPASSPMRTIAVTSTGWLNMPIRRTAGCTPMC